MATGAAQQNPDDGSLGLAPDGGVCLFSSDENTDCVCPEPPATCQAARLCGGGGLVGYIDPVDALATGSVYNTDGAYECVEISEEDCPDPVPSYVDTSGWVEAEDCNDETLCVLPSSPCEGCAPGATLARYDLTFDAVQLSSCGPCDWGMTPATFSGTWRVTQTGDSGDCEWAYSEPTTAFRLTFEIAPDDCTIVGNDTISFSMLRGTSPNEWLVSVGLVNTSTSPFTTVQIFSGTLVTDDCASTATVDNDYTAYVCDTVNSPPIHTFGKNGTCTITPV